MGVTGTLTAAGVTFQVEGQEFEVGVNAAEITQFLERLTYIIATNCTVLHSDHGARHEHDVYSNGTLGRPRYT